MLSSPTNNSDLPLLPEAWDRVCSFLPKPSLFRLRLASSRLSDIALPWAYKSLRLEGHGDSAERFVEIAKSPKLRGLVRELTVDTWVGSEFRYNANWDYKLPVPFMNALPYVFYFSRITALHMRFSEFCGEDDRNWGRSIEETWNFRYRVLDTVCHCVAGMWTMERQIKIDEKADLDEYVPEYPKYDLGVPQDHGMQLKELTIANLADYDDPYLSSSEAYQKVMCLPSLVDLKLLIATEADEAAPENAVYFEEKYDMFESLPSTWLAPGISENLKVLSLYFRDYWGWFPKMDFRSIGDSSPFPQLKVLALGNYIFSHDWQIDWFASVGQKNASGGLEELYLDDCPILFEARQLGPLSSSDPGYPVTSIVMSQGWNTETHKYPMRWYHILSRWATSMKGLKVFRMGHGTWDGAPSDTLNSAQRHEAYADINKDIMKYRLCHNAHRSFACPAPIDRETSDEIPEEAWASGKYLHGAGISEFRGSQMQYIQYDIGRGPSPWLETIRHHESWQDGYALEDETLVKDDAAYEALMAATEARATRTGARNIQP